MGNAAAPIGQPLDVVRGQDFTIVATASSVTSIAGWLITFQAWKVSEENLIEKTLGNGVVLTNPSTGVITVSITAADTASLSPGQYGWHLLRTNPGAHVQIARGAFIIEDDGVTAADATQFAITGVPSTVLVGTTFSITVTAETSTGAIADGYSGVMHFTSTDSHAVLPADASVVIGVFSVTLNTLGNQTITVTNIVGASFSNTSSVVHVISTYVPAYKFNDLRNSMYIPMVFG